MLAVAVAAVAIGLLLGGIAGFAIGQKWVNERPMVWTVGAIAFVAASVLNFYGRWAGLDWLSIGALGLMAGILTGVKYGGFPEVRAWEAKPRPKDDGPATWDEAAGQSGSTTSDAEADSPTPPSE